MGRKDFIFNNILLCLAWFVGMVVFGSIAAGSSSALAMLFAIASGAWYILHSATYHSMVKQQTQRRWLGIRRMAYFLLLSLACCQVLWGVWRSCIVSSSPQKILADLTVEDDDECRDEGPR